LIRLGREVAGDVAGIVEDANDLDLPGCLIGDLVNKRTCSAGRGM
jgi:hypothetical protein